MTMESRFDQLLARRRFLELAGTGIGSAALASLFGQDLLAQTPGAASAGVGALPGLPHHAPKAKRIIYLFQSGAPSQHELWDYKPTLQERMGEDLPPSVRGDQRVTTMTAGQERFPLVPSKFKFAQHGQSRAWVSDLMPHTAKIVDELCFIKSMHTE
ncbi:MAG TPA: sulfatase, partial [Acidobacteria bacterium]|nr:sulfatase [Acidobacteriota bacterium]